VTAGVSSETPSMSIAYAEDAAAAGARALMLLPPLGYAGDAREIEAVYRAVARSTELPIMAYNNPKASGGTDMPPALVARLAEIDGVVAIKECSGDARRLAWLVNATDGFEVLVGGDDWALEGFCAGATGWISGVANVAPRECVDLLRLCREGSLDEARRVYARILPLARLDMRPKLVQFFKAAMDMTGRRGGPCRPPRLELTDAERREGGGGGGPRGGSGRVRASRVFHAVDSHTEGMPTRVVTGGVGRIAGASMLERKLYFEQHMDGLRLMLMREPRGHGAMSGAILQPPLRDGADWGVLFIEVSGCLPMCGHGTIGVATVLVETGMVEVSEPETVVCLDTPAGLVEARVAVEQGRARSVALRNVPSFLLGRDRDIELEGRVLSYDMAFGGNFYAILPAGAAGLEVDPARAGELVERGLDVMAAINSADRPEHPADPRISGCKHVIFTAPGEDGPHSQRSATSIHPGWLDRSPCGTGTSAKLAALHARGELKVGERFVNRSVIGTRFGGRIVAETEVGGLPAVVPEITGRAWITGMGQYVLDPDDPFPEGFAL
jgi:proline racemase